MFESVLQFNVVRTETVLRYPKMKICPREMYPCGRSVSTVDKRTKKPLHIV